MYISDFHVMCCLSLINITGLCVNRKNYMCAIYFQRPSFNLI